MMAGRLSQEEKQQIQTLVTRGLGAGQIAFRLNRKASTVRYHMTSTGLAPVGSKSRPYLRNGVTVIPFTPEEDEYALSWSKAGHNDRTIARWLSEQFGNCRSTHTVWWRLRVLMAREKEGAAVGD